MVIPEFLKKKANPIEYKAWLDSSFFRNLRQYQWWRYSVTSILSIVSNWEFLDQIFAKIPKENSRKAMDNWTKLHADIEDSYNNNKFILWTSNNAKAWLKFYTEIGSQWKSIVQEEKLYWDGQWWTVDAVMKVEWKFTIIDWKTAKVMPKWAFLHKYEMQLWIYHKMYEETHGVKVEQWKIVVFQVASYKILSYTRDQLLWFAKNFEEVKRQFNILKTKYLKPMKLITNVNLDESVIIEKSSFVTGKNWSGKSSILNSVEMALYWTINWVRPKVKWSFEFTSEYSFKAKELPLQNIIYARFLDLQPADKKKTLLNLVVDDEIIGNFWKFWNTDIEKSIKAVQAESKKFKDWIKNSETRMTVLQEENEKDAITLGTYPKKIDVDFEFIDEAALAVALNKKKASMDIFKQQAIDIRENKCNSCGQKLPWEENIEVTLKWIEKDLLKETKEYKVDYDEYIAATEHNKKWEQISKNKILKAEKDMLLANVTRREDDISKLVQSLTDLKKDWIFDIEQYVKNELYGEISKKFSLKDFEIDLSTWFKLLYKWKDFTTMSRGQKFTANIYFSIWLLRQLDCRILCIDDAEMLHPAIQKEIIKEIKDFDFLFAVVTDTDLKIISA